MGGSRCEQRVAGVDEVPTDLGPTVVTIGVFDGVHRGHQAIIAHAVAAGAGERGGLPRRSCVTFDPHPSEVVRPGTHPAVLTDRDATAELLEALGADARLVLPVHPSSCPAGAGGVRPRRAGRARCTRRRSWSGENFRFGHRAAGDVARSPSSARRSGFAVEGCAAGRRATTAAGPRRTSASCVAEGDVEAAAAALGRPHRVEGVVVHGDHRGRELGFPTANLRAEPARGGPGRRRLRRLAGPRRGEPATPLPAAISHRHQPDVRRRRAPGRGVRARPRRPRPLRRAGRRRLRRAAARDACGSTPSTR